ncbi:MAG: Nucleoside triphosphate pyrophosphohydrolase [Chlamydiales bacterium]|nr:Nucleoside triphosphate pyrophosphohydrolase [Chlamydiales bacterium]
MHNNTAQEEFKKLLNIADTLLGPEGCPWDREQTVVSMRESVLEEACEVIEAIDEGSDTDLIEELGDLLYNVIFFCKLAEKEERFKTQDPVRSICEKLVSRHPHVFSDTKLGSMEAVVEQWERLKKEEKTERESLMDGIPKGMPALARAYKIAGKMERADYDFYVEDELFESEEDLGKLLWLVVRQARQQEINPETALRKEMLNQEKAFREWERATDH